MSNEEPLHTNRDHFNYGSQPIKNEQSGTKESWAVIISKIIESIEVPNVNKDPEGSIKGMKTLNGINDLIKIIINLESNRHPLSPEDIERAAELSSEVQEATYTPQHKITYKHGFTDGANFAKQHHKLGK